MSMYIHQKGIILLLSLKERETEREREGSYMDMALCSIEFV